MPDAHNRDRRTPLISEVPDKPGASSLCAPVSRHRPETVDGPRRCHVFDREGEPTAMSETLLVLVIGTSIPETTLDTRTCTVVVAGRRRFR